MAAQTIDSLVVELGLDPKNFTKGQNEAIRSFKQTAIEARKQGASIEKAGESAAEFLGKVRTQALSLAALFLGGLGIEKMLTQFATVTSQAGRTAAAIGMTVEGLTEWQLAAERFGVGAEEVSGGFVALTKSLEEFRATRVPPESFQWLAQAGVTIDQLYDKTGKLKTASQVWMLALTALSGKAQREGMAAAMPLAARIGMPMNLVVQGPRAMQEMLERARPLAVTKEQAAAAAQFQSAWAETRQSMEAISRILLTQFNPALLFLLEKLSWFFGRKPEGAPADWKQATGIGTRPSWYGKTWDQMSFMEKMLLPPEEIQRRLAGGEPGIPQPPPANQYKMRGGGTRRVEFGGEPDPWQLGTTRIPPFGARGAGLLSPTMNSSTTDVNIGSIVINQAGDADAIGADVGALIRRYTIGASANNGPR